jgi:hypothetical protein
VDCKTFAIVPSLRYGYFCRFASFAVILPSEFSFSTVKYQYIPYLERLLKIQKDNGVINEEMRSVYHITVPYRISLIVCRT